MLTPKGRDDVRATGGNCAKQSDSGDFTEGGHSEKSGARLTPSPGPKPLSGLPSQMTWWTSSSWRWGTQGHTPVSSAAPLQVRWCPGAGGTLDPWPGPCAACCQRSLCKTRLPGKRRDSLPTLPGGAARGGGGVRASFPRPRTGCCTSGGNFSHWREKQENPHPDPLLGQSASGGRPRSPVPGPGTLCGRNSERPPSLGSPERPRPLLLAVSRREAHVGSHSLGTA